MNLADLFSPEAGQARTAWLNRQDKRAADALAYFLGPTGIPDRLHALGDLAWLMSPAGDVREMYDQSGNLMQARTPLEAATAATALTAAAGSMFIPGNARAVAEGVEGAGDAARRFATDDAGAFAGTRALTADRAALSRAEEMTGAGASRDEVWRETGWFRGLDGKWRFEIDDSGARVDLEGYKPDPSGFPGKLGELLTHDDLFAAYPALRDTDVSVGELDGGVAGSYLRPGGFFESGMVMLNPKAHDPKRTLLHELQHGVQGLEGFAEGADSRAAIQPGTPAWDIYQDKLRDLTATISFEDFFRNAGLTDEAAARRMYENYVLPASQDTPAQRARVLREAQVEAYRRAAGEVEARNVETRIPLTAPQRAATAPWATQDRPDAAVILPQRQSR